MTIIGGPDKVEMVAGLLISQIRAGKICTLTGEPGSGKTYLVGEILRQLGYGETVNSPTFNIVNRYESGDRKIYHMDLYRLKSLEEALDIGIEEYIYSGDICLIEWPELITEILPEDTVRLKIEVMGNERKYSWN